MRFYNILTVGQFSRKLSLSIINTDCSGRMMSGYNVTIGWTGEEVRALVWMFDYWVDWGGGSCPYMDVFQCSGQRIHTHIVTCVSLLVWILRWPSMNTTTRYVCVCVCGCGCGV